MLPAMPELSLKPLAFAVRSRRLALRDQARCGLALPLRACTGAGRLIGLFTRPVGAPWLPLCPNLMQEIERGVGRR